MINKRNFSLSLARKLDMPHSTCKTILDKFIEVMEESIMDWQDISLLGLGRFSLMKRKPKKWINPRTLESIQTPWYTTMKFKVWKPLRDKIKNKFINN